MLEEEQKRKIYEQIDKALKDGRDIGLYKDKFSSALDTINTIIKEYQITDAGDVTMIIDFYNAMKWDGPKYPFH